MSGSLHWMICALLVPQSAFSLLGFSCPDAMEGALGVFYGRFLANGKSEETAVFTA
jgi:hypothetical protein